MLLLNLHVFVFWLVIEILLVCLWMVSKRVFKISMKVICTNWKIVLNIWVFLSIIYRLWLLIYTVIGILLLFLLFGFLFKIRVLLDNLSIKFL